MDPTSCGTKVYPRGHHTTCAIYNVHRQCDIFMHRPLDRQWQIWEYILLVTFIAHSRIRFENFNRSVLNFPGRERPQRKFVPVFSRFRSPSKGFMELLGREGCKTDWLLGFYWALMIQVLRNTSIRLCLYFWFIAQLFLLSWLCSHHEGKDIQSGRYRTFWKTAELFTCSQSTGKRWGWG